MTEEQKQNNAVSNDAKPNSAVRDDAKPNNAVRDDAKLSTTLPDSVSMGVDIVEIARMKKILERTPSFPKRVFSEDERAYCEKTSSPVYHYATRFAAKEAVLKALGTGFTQGIGVKDIEVVLNSKGKPYVKLYRRAAEVAMELDITELPISLSYTHAEAVACVLALTANSDMKAQKKVSPTEELTRQFKEARQMLDDIDAKKASGKQGVAPGQTALFDDNSHDESAL